MSQVPWPRLVLDTLHVCPTLGVVDGILPPERGIPICIRISHGLNLGAGLAHQGPDRCGCRRGRARAGHLDWDRTRASGLNNAPIISHVAHENAGDDEGCEYSRHCGDTTVVGLHRALCCRQRNDPYKNAISAISRTPIARSGVLLRTPRSLLSTAVMHEPRGRLGFETGTPTLNNWAHNRDRPSTSAAWCRCHSGRVRPGRAKP